ncbi:MAG: hypothetical protein M3R10_04400 [Verrucomicrobiota bacterium]|nr:hypothetical protein [Verrucomicrobiota bacterium]
MLAFIFSSALASAAPVHADVLLSAGHQGRPASCRFFAQRKCNLGAAGERERTPVVIAEAARVLRAHGVNVIVEPADFHGTFSVKEAVFVHFDGSVPPCASGASIGYHRAQDEDAANAWRAYYSKYWKFRFQPDNFTDNLRDYYGFRQVDASDAALVIELGELSCPPQRAWLEPRIKWTGELIAQFLLQRLKR